MWEVFFSYKYVPTPWTKHTKTTVRGAPSLEIPRVVNLIFLLLSLSPPRCPLPPRRAVHHRSSTHRWSSLSMKTRRCRPSSAAVHPASLVCLASHATILHMPVSMSSDPFVHLHTYQSSRHACPVDLLHPWSLEIRSSR